MTYLHTWRRQVAVMVWQIPDAVDTVVCIPDDGWWYHPKHVEQFPSCWIYIRIFLWCPDPWMLNRKCMLLVHRLGKLLSCFVWLWGIVSRGTLFHWGQSDQGVEKSGTWSGWWLVGGWTGWTHRSLPFTGCWGMSWRWWTSHTSGNFYYI